jgi:hypothetical protein
MNALRVLAAGNDCGRLNGFCGKQDSAALPSQDRAKRMPPMYRYDIPAGIVSVNSLSPGFTEYVSGNLIVRVSGVLVVGEESFFDACGVEISRTRPSNSIVTVTRCGPAIAPSEWPPA